MGLNSNIILVVNASSSRWDSLLQLFGVSILFVIVLAITYYTTRFIGGVKLQKDHKSNFHVIETFKITNNKFLQLISIGNKFIVISVSKDNITFIIEVEESEVHKLEQGIIPNYNFSDILNKMKLKQSEKNNQDSDNK